MTSLKQRATIIDALGTSLSYGGQALDAVPDLLGQVLKEESWREFETRLGEHVEHQRFTDFVTERPLAGLGASVDLLRRLVADDPKLADKLEKAIAIEQGQHRVNDNVRNRQGNAREQALRRLRKSRPDLHAKVLAKELTPHRAMVEAGFRHPTVTVPTDDPERLAATLRRHLKPKDLAFLAELLGDIG